MRRSFESRTLLADVAALGLATLALAACNPDKKPQSEPTPKYVDHVAVTLDYSELMPDGKTCEGLDPKQPRKHAERRCFSPLRIAPSLSAEMVNKTRRDAFGNPEPVWPYEGYKGSQPDILDVVCQVKGEKGGSVRGVDIWNVIRAPAEYIEEGELDDIAGGQLKVGAEKNEQGEITRVFVFAPAKWARRQDRPAPVSPADYIYQDLAACTKEQNPGNFQPVS